METKQPLLSICIPTYNRANVLKDNLASLIQTPGFDNRVEVVISDNCSTDETCTIGTDYANNYPNIKYFRNETNVGGCKNILLSLERGSGVFLKLVNDYSFFQKDGLLFLLNLIDEYKKEKPVFYYHYEYGNKKPYIKITNDINDIVLTERCKLGWLSCFGYWKEDFLAIPNREQKFETLFPQIDWFFRSYKNNKKILYCQKKILLRKDITEKYKLNKEGYNYIKVHGVNYVNLLKEYISENILDEKVIEPVKRSLIYPIAYMIVMIKLARQNFYSYKIDDAWSIIKQEFGHYPWFPRTLFTSLIRATIVVSIQRFLNITRLDKFIDIEACYCKCSNLLLKIKS